jgi:hypothetical protein
MKSGFLGELKAPEMGNETTRNFETWEMIETLKTSEMVMKPPTCCHTKSLVAHQIVNLHGAHH